MKQQTTNDRDTAFAPFLSAYEIVVDDVHITNNISYDEEKMILLVDNLPAAHFLNGDLGRATKSTFVSQETTDDE